MAEITSNFAQSWIKLNQNTAANQFELQFQMLQKTVINRTNDKIDKVYEEYESSSRVREGLSKKRAELETKIPQIADYVRDTQSNYERVGDIISKITELQNSYGDTVTSEEVASFESLRDELSAQVSDLRSLTFPTLVDTYALNDLKAQVSDIEAMTLVEGDATGTANQEVSDYLSSLSDKASDTLSATSTTLALANDISIKYQAKLVDVDSAILEEDTVKQANLSQDIENLKIETSNFLQAISLSYEAQSYSTTYFSDALSTGFKPEEGSILNIFS